MTNVSDPGSGLDPDWIRIHLGRCIRIRIQEGKKSHKNRKKL
jgi:hypothetical protein